MRSVVHFIVLSLIVVSAAQAQPEHQAEARRLAQKAQSLIDKGKYDEGLVLLAKASELDTVASIYRYDQAYVYYARKDYPRVVNIIEGLLDKPDVLDTWYERLGSAYNNLGNAEKAIEIYREGLCRFPDSGPLHAELGFIMAVREESYGAGMLYWEEGIRRAPAFPSNYYWAAKALCSGTEKLWGMIYGEIFYNLEIATPRSEEISALLFKTYRDAIHFSNGGESFSVNIGEGIELPSLLDSGTTKYPFSSYYTMAMLGTILDAEAPFKKLTTIRAIHALRAAFQKMWRQQKYDEKYPNVLFSFHDKLAAAGHFEAYDYWLFRAGAENEQSRWAERNAQAFNDAGRWLLPHRLLPDSSNVFCRTLVE